MAGRKKRNIGRLPKKYEAMVQSTGKHCRGRPKRKVQSPSSLTTSIHVNPAQSLDLLSSIAESPLCLPSESWSRHCSEVDIKMCKLQDCNGSMKVIISLTVLSNGSWTIHSHDIEINPSSSIFSEIPSTLTWQSTQDLIALIDKLEICPGHPDQELVDFVRSCGGTISTGSQELLAKLDDYAPVTLKKKRYNVTVRSATCNILVASGKCHSCTHSRRTIRSQFRRWKATQKSTPTRHTSASSHTNLKHMSTALTKQRLANVRKRLVLAERNVIALKAKIARRVESEGVNVSEEMHLDMQNLTEAMSDEIKGYENDSFQRLLWEQQLTASKLHSHKQMKWHPMMIRWSLFMKSKSSSGYEALRKVIRLPSSRTLRDYTHIYNPKFGFQREVDQQLYAEMDVDKLSDHQKFIGIVFDEMKVKEGIVYEKHSNQVVGFVNLGEITNQLLEFERSCNDDSGQLQEKTPPVARYINCIMVRGIFVNVKFAYAQFATIGASADLIFPSVWEAVKRLESLGLKVVSITCDGAAPNRKFFNMHGTNSKKKELIYKTRNIYSEDERFIYFFVDTPHLLKTTRNCFSQSFGHSYKRAMWKNGKFISWEHIRRVYKKRTSAGISLVPKLKFEHLQLTSFSRMRVYLAAQVLSTTVANALSFLEEDDTSETENFIRYMDKFFDCLNVRSLREGTNKLKPNLFPYRKPSDDRLKWLEEDFLQYLTDWEAEVQRRDKFTPGEKARMLLSRETMSGLRITVKSFVEVARFLLKQKGVEYVLSEKFNQDPVEAYFGLQRAHGGRCDNPSVQQFIKNTVSLRIQKSAALAPLRGNCRKHATKITIDNTPLPKRQRR